MFIPHPTELTSLPGHFTFHPATAVRAAEGAQDAARLLRTLLRPATGLPLADSPTGAVVLALDASTHGRLGAEGYELTVAPDTVLLRAARPAGLLHGVQTIRQLLPPEALSQRPVVGTAWRLPCVRVTDVPRFGWRGAMLDVARHFQPVSFVSSTSN